MSWQPIGTAPHNELLLILGRYRLQFKPDPVYVLGTFTDQKWRLDWPCPPDPPPTPPMPPDGPDLPNDFIPKFWMKLPPPPNLGA